ncbi:DUF421 domain-containing protein [soil metagenome]|nr:DUF421 domain-containing protein [Acidobacteriota bacterium]
MFFESWTRIWQTAIAGIFAYAALVAFLRISGKRTLSKMNAFDLVVTVALGSTLAAILTSPDTLLAEGLVALGLLIALQYAVAWSSLRFPWFEGIVKSTPTLLVYRGEIRDAAMRSQRVTRDEVLAALRSAGVSDLSRAGAVVLETDGSFSVIRAEALASQSAGALENLETGSQG